MPIRIHPYPKTYQDCVNEMIDGMIECEVRIRKLEEAFALKYSPDQPRDGHGRWTSGGGGSLDVAGATNKLNQEADKLKQSQIAKGKPNEFGEGRCAHYVGEAIVDGGGLTSAGHWPGEAKDFGPWLEANGFQETAGSAYPAIYPPSGNFPAEGDVAVIQPTNNDPHGHTAMYNGSKWVSDFKQSGFWPGPHYRAETPSYAIYRHPGEL